MKIRAAVVKKKGQPFEIETLELAPPRENEVLVRTRAAGICHSDWNIRTGETEHPLPAAVGHEGAGIVEALGERVTTLRKGDHVALSWAPGCGTCFYCSGSRPALCETWKEALWAGTLLDGTTRLSLDGRPVYHYCALGCFAEYAVVPESCCVPVKKEVPPEIAALIGCSVTTGLGASLNTVQIDKGASVVIYGLGGVGLSILAGARLAEAASIICIDLREEKLELARSLGATDAFIAAGQTHERILAATAQRGADYVFEATGSSEVQEAAFEAVRPGGKLILVGLSAMGTRTNFPGSVITRQEKTILGSYYGSCDPHRDFPLYCEMYLRGELDLDRLVSKTYRLEEINTAYKDMLKGKAARGLIVF